MHIYNFLIINKLSGVTLLNKSYGLLEDADDSPFLFSAAMTAIQDLMTDIQIGRVNTIKTDDYHIIGEASDRFVIFCIGLFETNSIIINFLKKVGRSLETWIKHGDKLIDIDDTIANIIEVMFDQFVDLWGTFISRTGIFIDEEKLGYQSTTPYFDPNVELLLTGYFTSLSKSLSRHPHAFYDILPSGGSVLSVMMHRHGIRMIVYTYFEDLELQKAISNKQNFLNKAFSFIENHGKLIVQTEGIPEKLEEEWEKFNTELRESIIRRKDIDLDFLNNEEIINYFNGHLPDIIDCVIRGKPVALLCKDEINLDQIIDLLMYITGTSSGSAMFNEEEPQRITIFNSYELEKVKNLNYEIFDLTKRKLTISEDPSYIYKIWQRTYNPRRPVKDILSDLHIETGHIWDICLGILIQYIFGQSQDVIFDSIPKDEYGLLFNDLISWINPYVLLQVDRKKEPGEKKFNW